MQPGNRRLNDRFARLLQYARSSSSMDALEEFLSAPCVSDIDDPLTHWNGVYTATKNLEKRALARMALDFLSAPAASTDVERAFSRGGLTVSKRRHSLNDESTQAATVLSSWAMVGGIIPEGKILEVFRDKSKRSKGKSKAVTEVNSAIIVEDN